MKDVIISIDNHEKECFGELGYIVPEDFLNGKTAEALYRNLIRFYPAYLLKAVLVSDVQHGDKKFSARAVSEINSEIRTIQFEKEHLSLFFSKYQYNPYEWDEERNEILAKVFDRYVDDEIKTVKREKKHKNALFVCFDDNIMGWVKRHEEYGVLMEKCLEAIERVLSTKTYDILYLYNENLAFADKLKQKYGIKIRSAIGKDGMFDWNALCESSVLIGVSSPVCIVMDLMKKCQGEAWEEKHIFDFRELCLRKWKLDDLIWIFTGGEDSEQYAELIRRRKNDDRHRCFSFFMNRWALQYEKGLTLSGLLREKGYSCIALYGYGVVGKFVCQDLLKNNEITLACVIDQNNYTISGVPCVCSDELSDELSVDAIIVSTLFLFDEIRLMLREKGITLPIVPIEYLVFDILF